MRYALYYTPPMSHPLAQAAAAWLGRDAFSGELTDPVAIGGLDSDAVAYHTAAPRRYGFHATLKAPFRLADPAMEPEFLADIMHFSTETAPFVLPPLKVSRLGPFFALTPSAPCDELHAFADQVVTAFDAHRAPLTEAEIQRRNSEKMTQKELEYLHHWGYPYVFDAFRFHMTLTGSVDAEDADAVERALHLWFDPLLEEPLTVDSLALFTEPENGAPFLVHSLHPLGRPKQRRASI